MLEKKIRVVFGKKVRVVLGKNNKVFLGKVKVLVVKIRVFKKIRVRFGKTS